MMNQVKTGRFIAQLRREMRLTQEKMGEKLGITNKTVSRWENGMYLPDVEMLQLLGKEFHVSINELLAGERISREKLAEKADENIVGVLKIMEQKSVIGAGEFGAVAPVKKDQEAIRDTNREYWDTKGNDFLGIIRLPCYGAFLSEDQLKLFGNVSGKKVLEAACGSGESLLYMAGRKVSELWGIELSQKRIEQAREALKGKAPEAKFVCSCIEEYHTSLQNYFDIVYSIYGAGWFTDLDAAFANIASYLKKDGVFIFSWSHPLHKCLSYESGRLVLKKSYFDETWYSVMLDGGEIILADRKLSTYINALSRAGFVIEQLIEESDQEIIKDNPGAFSAKAEMIPVTFVVKARKL